MDRAVEVAGDIVAAGSAISGLILVYIGSLTASFGSYEAPEKRAVIGSFQRRAWFAFIGLIFFMASVALALFGKWLVIPCMILAALALLVLALAWVVATAILSVLEIR